MGKETTDIVKSILLICIGILVFIAPVKFGLTIDPDSYNFPKGIYEWLFFQWPHGIWWIGIIVLFILWLIWSISSGQIKIRYSLLDIIIFVFLVSATISTFKAPNIHLARICLTQYFCYAITYFLILNILEGEKDLRFLLNVLLIPAIFISLYAIYQYYIGLPQTRVFASQYLDIGLIKERLESGRVFSTFIYPNTLAGYLLLCIPMTLTLSPLQRGRGKGEGRRKLTRILIVLIMLYALYLTFYRGSGSFGKIKNTVTYRLENWTAGFRMIKENPIFGVGPYNFCVLYPKYKLDIAEEIQNAHNNFLQIWAEQGIVGFLAFCSIWFVAIKKGLGKKVKNYRWLLLGIIAFIIHNLIDFDWYVPGVTVIAWIFIGILVKKSNCYKERIFQIRKWWIKGIFLFVLLLCFLFMLLHLERNLIAGYYLQETKAALNNNNIILAEVLCGASSSMDRENPEVYFLLGKINTKKRDYLNSISWYKKALEYNPYSSSYYYNMALSYIYQTEISRDRLLMDYIGEAFKKAVEFYPTNPFYRLQLAQFYEAKNQYVLSIEEYRYCLELNNKIEREYKIYGKMLKHLILTDSVVSEIRKKI